MGKREDLLKLGMSTNIGRFFGRLIEIETNLRLASMYCKDFRASTRNSLIRGYKKMGKKTTKIIEAYNGLYGPSIVEVGVIGIVDPLDYSKKAYDVVIESKVFFKEGWILKIIDEIAAILAKLIFELTYTK